MKHRGHTGVGMHAKEHSRWVSRLRGSPGFRHVSRVYGQTTWLTILRKSNQYSTWFLSVNHQHFSVREVPTTPEAFSLWLETQVSNYSKKMPRNSAQRKCLPLPPPHLPSNTPQNSALWRILDQHLHLQIFRFSKEL